MDARILTNRGQVAGSITNHYEAMVCPGLHACPHGRGEDDLQRKFEENTRISCSKPARIALQYLLDVGHFERRQLALAWRTKSLYWDWAAGRLVSNASRIETAYGYFLMALGAVAILAFVIKAVSGGASLLAGEQFMALGAAAMLSAMIPFAEKYLVRPNRIARRVEPALAAFYASGEAGGAS